MVIVPVITQVTKPHWKPFLWGCRLFIFRVLRWFTSFLSIIDYNEKTDGLEKGPGTPECPTGKGDHTTYPHPSIYTSPFRKVSVRVFHGSLLESIILSRTG